MGVKDGQVSPDTQAAVHTCSWLSCCRRLPPGRRTNGYWANVDNLRRELEAEAASGLGSTDGDNMQSANAEHSEGVVAYVGCHAHKLLRLSMSYTPACKLW